MGSYPKLADLMAAYPEVMIFRAFSTLNARNLLYLQAELAYMEIELNEVTKEDNACGNTSRKAYGSSWKRLSDSLNADDGDPIQWELFLRIREKLAQYNEALLQQAQLSSLSTPDGENIRGLRKWLEREHYGDNFLAGTIEGVWDVEKGHSDFVGITSKDGEKDVLTRKISNLVPMIQRKFATGSQPADRVWGVSESKGARLADGLSTVLSCLLPTVSIFVLYLIHNMRLRLGMILVFTALLAVVLVFVTKARRVEVFAITTAFAAVQVVFVSGTDANSNAS